MTIRIVRLGSRRVPGEGVRIGTVRRPPRDIPKEDYAKKDWFDVWLPELSPEAETVKRALAANSDAAWQIFAKKYRTEMGRPEPGRLLDLLAALSKTAPFSVGCYCEDEKRCHRSILRVLLKEHGAAVE
ncbi:MAG: DUF488 family protein [Betaproteobacteria bacterium]|nr:DUF488 family protein [Betaproteobacteria bacterium]